MEITEAKVKLLGRPSDRLKALCSITLDNSFMVKELKVIEGSKGIFVAMPSRKITDHCPKCRGKNAVSSRFCCECGCKLEARRGPVDMHGRVLLFEDIAHPITIQCRDMIRDKVLAVYKNEVGRSRKPDYKPNELKEYPSEFQKEQEIT